jgi:hypothetical protein
MTAATAYATCEYCGRPLSVEEFGYDALVRHPSQRLTEAASFLLADRTGEGKTSGRPGGIGNERLGIGSILDQMAAIYPAYIHAAAHPVSFTRERNEFLFGMLD